MQYKESYEQNFDTLIQQSVKSSTQFKYWYLGLELIFKFLIFIYSIQNVDIDLYFDALRYGKK